MSFAAVAVAGVAASAIGAGVNAASASSAASASKKQYNRALAAGTRNNQQALDNANDWLNQNAQVIKDAYGQNPEIINRNSQELTDLMNPYVQSGVLNLNRLNAELDSNGFLGRQYDWGQYLKDSGQDPNLTQADLLKHFTGEDMEKYDPGYRFRLDQGLQSNDRLAAARGGVLGGGQLKAQQRYAQDYASGEFANAWNRDNLRKQQNLANWQNMWTNNFNAKNQRYAQLKGMADSGQNAAEYLGSGLQNNAMALANNNVGLGSALANNNNARIGARNEYASNMNNLLTGNASAQAQNSWNQAQATSQAMNGFAQNAAGMAGMYMKYNSPQSPKK